MIKIKLGILLACFTAVSAYQVFQTRIPNGEGVPHPCKANYLWKGVGHENVLGGGTRNKFGQDFAAAGFQWTKELCQKDSDGDGLSNGQELGDPECVWQAGDVPKTSIGLSHPGICDPFNTVECMEKNKWVDCSFSEFKCDAIHEPGVKNVTIRFPETEVPNTETNYYCMMFELPKDGDYHIISNIPVIANAQVMHHIIMSGCDETEKEIPDSYLNNAAPCGMAAHPQCNSIIGVWAVGYNGQCMHPDIGFRIGQNGFKKAVFQFHWNNPELKSGYKDSSGMTLYYTANRRVNDATMMMVGQEHLEIPPGLERYKVESTCSSDCTARQLKGPVYVTQALNHMHYMGRAMQLEQYRNGQRLRYLTDDQTYSYDSPSFVTMKNPVEVRPGDEIKTTCMFKSVGKDRTTFKGDGTSDEMCYGFLTIYPKQNMPQTYCGSWKSLPLCKVYFYPWEFPEIDGCRWYEFMNASHPITQQLHQEVHSRCKYFGSCLTECKNYIKTLRQQHPCMSGDISDLIRRYQRDIPTMGGFFAAVDSCDAEIQADKCKCGTCRPDDINSGHVIRSPIVLTLLALVILNYFL